MAEIEIRNLTKVFSGDVVAIDDVSLSIGDGEFIALVGPSGCGKSTLLRAIAGLEEVTSGEISIGGRDVTDLAPRHRDIAMVFQSYALYPHMSVRQNLGYGLKVRRMPKTEIRERVDRIAELLGLDELLERKPAQLSGGQRQHVAMGRAIVREPQAFLMDEPLSNLDAKMRVQMRTELIRLHRDEKLDLSGVITFNLDEYFPMPAASIQSYRRWMHEHFFKDVNIPADNIHIPDGLVPTERLDQHSRETKACEACGYVGLLMSN
jgi:ABC-type sugar transport system ATPase subunit